jgi:uncharacterized membrane protein HdeD (DUF308 family)/3',5'-cyclic AMP phosphodiesterase CpdA
VGSASRTDEPPEGWSQGAIGLAATLLLLAILALVSPCIAETAPEGLVGALLIVAGVIEGLHGFRRSVAASQRAAWHSASISIVMGVLLANAGAFVGGALALLLAGWFAIDAARYAWLGLRGGPGRTRPRTWVLPALGNGAVVVLIIVLRHHAATWTVAIAGALRILGTAWNLLAAPVFTAAESGGTVLDDLGLGDERQAAAMAERLAGQERSRAGIDRGWILAFVATLLAIHVGRMGFDRTALGIMSPGVAVLGDLCVALVVAFVVVVPVRLALRRATRGLERRAWRWYLAGPVGPWRARALVGRWLEGRMRFAIRLRDARYSWTAALSRGLQIGLPFAAVVAATVPVLGMSWYFDTENWAAGVWDSWAEARTDTWREAMIEAVAAQGSGDDGAAAFAVAPPGTTGPGDFAFIVIGDTGEGDASQHVLRDQLLAAAAHDAVKFVVLSSDVIYPSGAMKDYEAKFWLPFKGVDKPVYAIPGNHDWYDALEGFNATFLEPGAARIAMRARIEVDKGVTSTTEAGIERLVATASRLQREYRVPTALQKGPFFQVQTERFALLAVDTGVVRRVDPAERRWLEAALEASRGKFIMAVLGHPLYAGGHYQADGNEDFAAIHRLLREHGVAVVMAGDTHDLEYYVERFVTLAGPRTVRHFVNGGGGAYLSFGTALSWPSDPATATWAFYPTRAQVEAKIGAATPLWKRPLWWWTRRFDAWPVSAEWLSAAFDYNVAPFYQSFVEVHVEPSQGRVRFVPYGVHGRLRWSDLQASPDARPPDRSAGDEVEWVVPMSGAGAGRP